MKSTPMVFTKLAAAALIALISATTSHAQQPAGSAASAPKAVMPFTNYGFGDVYRGEVIRHVFVIRNEGSSDLVIKNFTAG